MTDEQYASQRKWDERFLVLAHLVATWSKDPSTRVGAVLVSPDRRSIYVGYNGFPAAMPDTPEYLVNREEKYSRVIHAEVNAVLNAPGPVRGFTCYVTFPPCDRCAVLLGQAGIAAVVSPPIDKTARWAETQVKAAGYFCEMGIERRYVP